MNRQRFPTSDPHLPSGPSTSSDRRGSCLVLALLAAATFQIVRRWDEGSLWRALPDAVLTIACTVTLFRLARRAPADARRAAAPLAGALAGFLILPVVVEMVLRWAAGEGEAFELVMLVCIRNAALASAALARRRGPARISFLFSGFLTLFSVSISDGQLVYVPAVVFAVVGLWILMGAYWERFQGRQAVESRRQVPVRIGVLGGLGALLAVSVGLLAGAQHELISLPGFMPSSGGTRSYDPYARQGIGDGDMLAAAKDQAMAFAPVESEQFLDSDMPSLYDMLVDRYGEPTVKPRQAKKAVALAGKNTGDRNQKTSQSKRSGREFAVARRKTQGRRSRPQDTESKALLYLLGTVPLHLALETYDAFDGATWMHEAGDPWPARLTLNSAGSGPWLEFEAVPRDWILARERHAIKTVNLRSPRFPSPPLLTAVHIDRVNRADLFGWTRDGVLQMEGQDGVPQFTVVHLVSNVLGLDAVRKYALHDAIAKDCPSFTRLPDVASLVEQQRLARLWTSGIPQGWSQVEAVISRLRSEFVLDDAAMAPAGCADVVGHFLKRRRGPDYLFATTAALLLRSCGYPTRLISGFYADAKHYDRRAGQTSVMGEDAHVWLEVAVTRGTWVALEPTPGYEPPRMVLTWSEWAAVAAGALVRWVRACWMGVMGASATMAILIWQRRRIVDAIASAIWRGRLLGEPRRAVLATMRLLECRARLAGCGRSRHETVAQCQRRWTRLCGASDTDSIATVIDLVDWVLYSPRRGEMPLAPDLVRRICRDTVRTISLHAMRRSRAGLSRNGRLL
jgi:protein-glutamine gamma-glutamyltransferase